MTIEGLGAGARQFSKSKTFILSYKLKKAMRRVSHCFLNTNIKIPVQITLR
jgi:hypothetical protein